MTSTSENLIRPASVLMLGCTIWVAGATSPAMPPVSSVFSGVAHAQEAPAPASEAAVPTPAAAPAAEAAPAAKPATSEAPAKQPTQAEIAAAAIEKKRQDSLAKARNMSSLMDRALEGRESLVLGKVKEAEKPSAPNQSAIPTQQELQDIVKRLAPAVRACAQGQSGLAEMDIVVYRDGRVTSAKVTTPPFFQTPAGQCMEGVLRRAHFPRFSQRQFRVRVPFALK